ncbi:MAE_28990/MAE_18760 family HEPN-like nuclease [Nocardia abscessus]|uniref:MAE_28990/MAE_18760 family HEPN-like nuclease n=1 Tax=Nocardia abscessus TaxID=120957 RepID=UPI002455F5BC|nr:MAE_28990/MAE_18760 family HEPN-like nuclease [Nocardia abscessus]
MTAKPTTPDALYDLIYDDLVWRRREIVLFTSQLDKTSEEFQKALLRSSVALLYAHWEGFVKNSCSYYLAHLSTKRISFQDLRPELAALSLRGKMTTAALAKKTSMHAELVRHIRERAAERATIPIDNDAIRTESNLSYPVLVEILTAVGCNPHLYSQFADLIDDQLVRARNKIAHGEYSFIKRPEWDELSRQVLWLMNDIATQLMNAAVEETYYATKARAFTPPA